MRKISCPVCDASLVDVINLSVCPTCGVEAPVAENFWDLKTYKSWNKNLRIEIIASGQSNIKRKNDKKINLYLIILAVLLLGVAVFVIGNSVGVFDSLSDRKPQVKRSSKVTKTTATTEETDIVQNTTEITTQSMFENDTLSAKIYAEFLGKVDSEKDVVKLAEALGTEAITGYECGFMKVEPGYLNGFSDTVDGFTEGAMFSPYIGSVPFVGYVFVSDDPAGLKTELLAKADLRWNICTEADEILCEVKGDYVFFVMCPSNQI